MARLAAALALSFLLGMARGQANPLASVLKLVGELEAKVIAEGEAEAKAFKEFAEWCEDAARNKEYEIKTAESKKSELEAAIGKATGDAEAAASKIEELAANIATGEADLKSATAIRDKEFAEFSASEAELTASIDTINRAVAILEREAAKHPAALAQVMVSSVSQLVQTLGTVIDAASFTAADKQRLTALVQAQQSADDDDFGAPAAATYKSHGSSILDVLEDLREKAEEQLSETRKAETNARHNFEMLKQSLEDQAAADTKDLEDKKASKASIEEAKATAEGDLQTTMKLLEDGRAALETAHSDCMTAAADHEVSFASRSEELKALAEAKKILKETTTGAAAQSYSFLQISEGARFHSRADLAQAEVLTLVRKLAKEHHSAALAQLASRIAAAAHLGSASGEDPFAKIKGLISDMISKLEAEAGTDATEKAYCDEQMAKTEQKKAELEFDIQKLTSKIDEATSKSAVLKETVAQVESDLAALAKSQAEIDKTRLDEHAVYLQAKADLELGLAGVRKALGVLRDYYASGNAAAMLQDGTSISAAMEQPSAPQKHSKASGAGSSIVGILEVVESDFAKNLAAVETEEADAESGYKKLSQANAISKTLKEQDVKYMTQESKSLDKTIGELSSDRDTGNTELSAVLEYYARIKERCIAKPETYEERSRRREEEIAGLKEALNILENEVAFTQRSKRGYRGRFLGVSQ